MDLLQRITGEMRLRIESADLSGVMGELNRRGIALHGISIRDDVTVECWVRREDKAKVEKLCQKRGERIQIIKRRGLYWKLGRAKKRPLMLFGLAFLLFLVLFLPSRVLFVKVEGNHQIPANRILEAAENCGIRFWASRREVRSERVKNALLEIMPELQWAGVNTKGCVAVLSVRERAAETARKEGGFVSGIVAGLDGVVFSCTATRGNLLCVPGQAVRAGELLISGFTDCGLTIRATSAQGEVFALTRRENQAVTPIQYRIRASEAVQSEKISLILGKKRINLWKDSGIWDTTCGRIYSEYYITLPGGFALPIGIAVEQSICASLSEGELSQEAAEAMLKDALTSYLKTQMIAGSIQSSREEFSQGEGCVTLAGEYVCTEMIGRVQREQIGE